MILCSLETVGAFPLILVESVEVSSQQAQLCFIRRVVVKSPGGTTDDFIEVLLFAF